MLHIACSHGLDQTTYGDAVDISLEFRPTVEAISSREHELRVVQGERVIRVMVVRANFGDSFRFTAQKRLQQFLGLPFKLIEIGLLE